MVTNNFFVPRWIRFSLWTSEQKVSDIFLSTTPFMKVYTIYMANYPHALETLSRIRSKSFEANRIIQAAEQTPEFKGLQVDSYLILPIQRVPRYILLLEQLLKFTPVSHPDRDGLERSVKEVRNIADHINEGIRDLESQRKVLSVNGKLSGRPSSLPSLVTPARRLVSQGDFFIKSSSKSIVANSLGILGGGSSKEQRTLFLFSDLLVLAKKSYGSSFAGSPTLEDDETAKYDYKDEFPLLRMWIVATDDVPPSPTSPASPSSKSDNTAACALRIVGPDRTITLFSSSRTDRDAWATRINETIDALRHGKLQRKTITDKNQADHSASKVNTSRNTIQAVNNNSRASVGRMIKEANLAPRAVTIDIGQHDAPFLPRRSSLGAANAYHACRTSSGSPQNLWQGSPETVPPVPPLNLQENANTIHRLDRMPVPTLGHPPSRPPK
jgi:hypothetical protein